jgi:hypothetical protein
MCREGRPFDEVCKACRQQALGLQIIKALLTWWPARNTDRARGFLMRISITSPKTQDMTLEKYLNAVVFEWAGE